MTKDPERVGELLAMPMRSATERAELSHVDWWQVAGANSYNDGDPTAQRAGMLAHYCDELSRGYAAMEERYMKCAAKYERLSRLEDEVGDYLDTIGDADRDLAERLSRIIHEDQQ